jgi:hypothetical protein
MKKVLLLQLALLAGLCVFAQLNPVVVNPQQDFSAIRPDYRDDGGIVGIQNSVPMVLNKSLLDDPNLGTTYYDLQTNTSLDHRLHYYSDGTMGGTFTRSQEQSGYSDRGTGYNFYDGTTWGLAPTARIETLRTGWPSYFPLGATGEGVIAHQNATSPLIKNTRPNKGTGTWTQTTLSVPAGASGLDWPRVVSNGPDNTYIHVIVVTGPTGNGGTVYQGLDGAIVYNRSLDGGATWGDWVILDGMTSSDYLGFGGDTYGWAEPLGETLCFVVADSWNDGFIMKSTDNGDTWTKTKFWTCLYNQWAGPDTTGTFYCPDGSNAVALDNTGKAHVLFGLQRARGDETGAKFWYPFTDGLIYWNEDMPELPQNLDPDLLYANGNYIGWVQDTMVFYQPIEELAYYYMSLSSMPQIIPDDNGHLFAIWSGVTTLRDQDNFMLRHLFARGSDDNGVTWADTIVDITGDFLYTWSECVFPSVAFNSTDELFILFQEDELGGTKLKGDGGAQGQTASTVNSMLLLSPLKSDILPTVGINNKKAPEFYLSACYPNPASDQSAFTLTLSKPASVNVQVYSLLGHTVMEMNQGSLPAGKHNITVDVSTLNNGVYFLSLEVNKEVRTVKLIVE